MPSSVSAAARSSLAKARAVPRWMCRGIWSSSRISASRCRGLSAQASSAPAAARAASSPKRAAMVASRAARAGRSSPPNQAGICDWNSAGVIGSRPNQKSSTVREWSIRGRIPAAMAPTRRPPGAPARPAVSVAASARTVRPAARWAPAPSRSARGRSAGRRSPAAPRCAVTCCASARFSTSSRLRTGKLQPARPRFGGRGATPVEGLRSAGAYSTRPRLPVRAPFACSVT